MREGEQSHFGDIREIVVFLLNGKLGFSRVVIFAKGDSYGGKSVPFGEIISIFCKGFSDHLSLYKGIMSLLFNLVQVEEWFGDKKSGKVDLVDLKLLPVACSPFPTLTRKLFQQALFKINNHK